MADRGWFDTAGFGLFVHWDHASQQGLELSWPLVGGVVTLPKCQSVAVADYHASAATFDPQAWDARAFAARAREWGAQYVTLTAKHHNGYAMFDTALSTHSVMHSPHGQDIVTSFVDAVREEGLGVGLYLSLSDWWHPDYPTFADDHKPYEFGVSPPIGDDAQWQRYLTFLSGQIRELLTGYGRIDIIWFDGGWERPEERWRTDEIESLIRELQPDILINDRLPGRGDFDTPEQFVPARPPARKWETCLTMNDSWGWNPDDTDYKSTHELIHTLCDVVGRGGNLLLNVSPRGDGSLPPEQVERLDAVGSWVRTHEEAVIGVGPGLEPWQFYGPSSRRPGAVYLHVLMRPYEQIVVRGIRLSTITGVRLVSDGRALTHRTRMSVLEQLFSDDPVGEIVIDLPEDVLDPHATVVALDLDDDPAVAGSAG